MLTCPCRREFCCLLPSHAPRGQLRPSCNVPRFAAALLFITMRARASQALQRLLQLRGVRHAGGPPQRDPRFAAVCDADLDFFRSVLGDAGVVTDEHELQPFNQ